MTRITVLAAALLCALFAMPASAQDIFAGVRSIDVEMTRVETCIASQYGVGDRYNGRRTASGSIFNTWATNPYTLAHKTLPFGSMVTVTNLSNGRSIRAMVTDRGPHVRGRCVDLGRAGANAIGMGGLAHVEVH
jgi:rare lipoprotein A